AAGRAEVDAAGERHQSAVELFEQLVGAFEQRYVRGVLEVGLPDDPGLAVAGAHGVRRAEALEPEHPGAAGGEMPGGGTAHAAQPDHDDVVAGHALRRSILGSTRGSGVTVTGRSRPKYRTWTPVPGAASAGG